MSDAPSPMEWKPADSIEYLRLNPLPADFIWRHNNGENAEVRPTYHVANYGKWLAETPYFPGLFELIHDLLFHAGSRLPDTPTLAAQLTAIRKEREGQLKLF